MFRTFIAIVFTATFGFALLGICVIAVTAAWEGLSETEMEEGGTFKELLQEEKAKVKDYYAPCFEGVDGEQVFKEEMKKAHDVGKETFDSVKVKAKEGLRILKETKEYMEEE